MLTYEVRSARLFVETSVDKTSGFLGSIPEKTRNPKFGSGSGRVALMNSGFFGSENPKKVKVRKAFGYPTQKNPNHKMLDPTRPGPELRVSGQVFTYFFSG